MGAPFVVSARYHLLMDIIEVEETTIYRIETRSGAGAYRRMREVYPDDPPTFFREMHRRYGNIQDDPHPAPYEDGLNSIHPEEFCGFANTQQLLDWMFREPEDAERLAEAGLFVAVYRVPVDRVRHGVRQSVFVKHDAELQKHIDPRAFIALFQD